MLKSLYWKLTLAFMLVAFTTAALVALFIRLTSANQLMQLVIEQQRSSLQQTLHSPWFCPPRPPHPQTTRLPITTLRTGRTERISLAWQIRKGW
jgi:hypothetical protein